MTKIIQSLCQFLNPKTCLHCKSLISNTLNELCLKCELNLCAYPTHHPKIHFTDNQTLNIYVLFFYQKHSPIQTLIKTMKYRSQNILGNYLFFKALALLPYFKDIDFVIPVPLFRGKELKRGGNQLDEFGKNLAQFYHAHYNKGILIKDKNTKSHSEKNKFQRDQLNNYYFKLSKPELLKDKCILLIDDLITTGNTIQAATQVLFEASCKKIHIMCIASGID